IADGGLFAYNPDLAAGLIGMTAYPNKKYLLVSLGTGKEEPVFSPKKIVDWGILRWMFNFVPSILDSSAKFNNLLLRNFFPFDVQFYRFNTKINKSSGALDDISERNIQRLMQDGETLVQERREDLDRLIDQLLRV
ncbi:MAG: hypothetical protein ACHQUC_10925, partial [Chlamydiales bacterium]